MRRLDILLLAVLLLSVSGLFVVLYVGLTALLERGPQ